MVTPINQSPHLLFRQALWKKICNYISEGLDTGKLTAKSENLEELTKQLMLLMTKAIDKYIPIAKLFNDLMRQGNLLEKGKWPRLSPLKNRKKEIILIQKHLDPYYFYQY